jgi:hypothetical protein
LFVVAADVFVFVVVVVDVDVVIVDNVKDLSGFLK